MLKANVKISPGLKRKLGEELDDFTEELIATAKDIAVKETPRRSGRARRAWEITGRGRNAEAVNEVPYIQRLDQGWSKQAPRGILKPTMRKLRSQSRRITR